MLTIEKDARDLLASRGFKGARVQSVHSAGDPEAMGADTIYFVHEDKTMYALVTVDTSESKGQIKILKITLETHEGW